MKNAIDTTFDFTSDTPHYWDNFWQNCDGLGCGSADPDTKSPKGFVNFFLLQDLVAEDYSEIKLFLQNNLAFTEDPRPQTVEEWFILYNNQMNFLAKRNERISKIRFDHENCIK